MQGQFSSKNMEKLMERPESEERNILFGNRFANDQETMLQSLMRNLPGMAYRCINDSRWTMLYISEGCLGLTGYSVPELIDNTMMSYEDLIHPDDRSLVRKAVNDAVENNEQFRIQYRIIRKNGELRWVWEQGCASPDDAGNPLYLDGFIADVSLLKTNEIELESIASDLREHNNMKDKFFSIIAHDLQNPIYAIVSIADFMDQNREMLNKAQLLDFCSQIHSSAQSINVLLENLLEWSRMKVGQIKRQNRRLSLYREIEEAIYHNAKHARDKGIAVHIEVEPSLPIITDQRMLGTVLKNLISNAVKFSDYGQMVVVRATRQGSITQIGITDEGVGMSRQKIAALFRIDEDIDSLGTANESGSGMGMILVKTFLDKLGGSIKVDSRVKKGTTVTLLIPDGDLDGASTSTSELNDTKPDTQPSDKEIDDNGTRRKTASDIK